MPSTKEIQHPLPPENLRSKFQKLLFNFFPAYRRTGGRIIYLSADWHFVKVRLRLNWQTRNYVGSIFGGSIYGSVDPIYMVQLIKILGKEYVVWDKAATIKYIKPIKKDVTAVFLLSSELVDEIKRNIKINHTYTVELPIIYKDAEGSSYAEVVKRIYIADRTYYNTKKTAVV
jgi:hypothetical protein